MKGRISIALFAWLVAVCPVAADKAEPPRPERPLGTWEQVHDDHTITLTIKGDRLQLTVTGKDGKAGKPLWLLDADYSVTKDSILYGIVTGVEVERKAVARGPGEGPGGVRPPGARPTRPGAPGGGEGPSEGEAGADLLRVDLGVDDVFRFRFRVDDDVLTIKTIRGDFPLKGRFKKKDDKPGTAPGEKPGAKKPDLKP